MDHTPRQSDHTKAERLRLIVKAFEWCGQEVTFEAVAIQYKRETGEVLEQGSAISSGMPAAAQPEGKSGVSASGTVGVSRQDDSTSGPTPERALWERPVTPDARNQLEKFPDRVVVPPKRTRRGKLLIEDLF